ncbi:MULTISPECIES: zinc ribbon domain-containing protein [unclassified Roseovarius]|uniref:double zinc ribbon domain-containing protein n=1 Tax=unclassified Roseovarius TaxID=2614913 RepID=UPI00273F6FDB|nr:MULTISPECIES: zinc ribbon domain-containing protein [unclassified Roseovarius]
MKCSSCQFENPPSARFCGQCGRELEAEDKGLFTWLTTSAQPGLAGKAIIALKLIGAFYVSMMLLGVLLYGF